MPKYFFFNTPTQPCQRRKYPQDVLISLELQGHTDTDINIPGSNCHSLSEVIVAFQLTKYT